MKKILLLLFLLILIKPASSQTIHRLLGASAFQDSLWVIDTTAFSVKRRIGPTPSSGGVFTGMNGIAKNPVTGTIYVINKQTAVAGRMLGKLNLLTGVVAIIGNLGDNFSSLTFTSDQKLFGVTGNGATVPETLFEIDTLTATTRLVKTLGNGADGEIICYQPSDNMIYHWSGNTTLVYEKFDTVSGPYNFIDIPVIGAASGETFGAVNIGPGEFITSNIGSSFNRFYSNGIVSPAFGSMPDDLRGMAFISCTRAISGTPSFCIGDSTVLSASTANSYQWYLNGASIAGATSSSITISSPGIYNCYLSDACGDDSLAVGIYVTINPLPVVTLTGTTTFCAGSSTLLSGSSGGSSQWYLNGVAIAGATSSTYTATTAGIYNMIKTNLSGCSDSAAVGKTITVNPLPVVMLTGTTTFCAGSSTLLTGTSGGTSQWYKNGVAISGATTPTYTATTAGVYNMIKTNLSGCFDSAAVGKTITLNPLPIVTLTGSSSICPGSSTLLTGSSGGTSQWYLNGVAIGGATSSTYTATSAGVYNMIKTNLSTCFDSAAVGITVTINIVDVTTTISGGTILANAVASTYQWINNCGTTNSIVAGAISQSYTPGANGDFAVIVTTGGCTDTSACITITTTGINDPHLNNLMKIVPNPNNGTFVIESSFKGDYSIVNSLGQTVLVMSLNSENNYSANIDKLSNGIYFIIGYNANQFVKQKIVVTK